MNLPPKRPHGLNENHILTALVLVSALWLWRSFAGDRAFDLLGTTASSVQKLTLFSGYVVVALFALGGWRFQIVERLKENLLAFAILAAAVVIGAALVLVN